MFVYLVEYVGALGSKYVVAVGNSLQFELLSVGYPMRHTTLLDQSDKISAIA